jgi:hypothetical protein
MSAVAFEDFLVRIYVDAEARARFKENPNAELGRAELNDEERTALMAIDWNGLEMAARSFARKRETKSNRRRDSKLKGAFRSLLKVLSALREKKRI